MNGTYGLLVLRKEDELIKREFGLLKLRIADLCVSRQDECTRNHQNRQIFDKSDIIRSSDIHLTKTAQHKRSYSNIKRPQTFISLFLDADLVAELKSQGNDWQKRLNSLLRELMGI